MADNTISIPDFETLNVDNKTVAFSCLEIDVAELIGSIRWDAASILNWRLKSSAWFAHQILMRMGGEFISLEIRAVDLAQAFWPGISDDAGRQRIGDLIVKLKEDQRESNFWMISMDTTRTKKRDDGSFYHLPTLYKPAEFAPLFYSVQMAAIECDLGKMQLQERRMRQRSIIESWLMSRGCKKIIRGKKEKSDKSEKQKSEKSECPSPCPHCFLKIEEKNPARIEELRRAPNEDFNAIIENSYDRMYRGLCEFNEINSEFRYAAKRMLHEAEMAINRAREMIIKNNKAGLKLVGGQPK